MDDQNIFQFETGITTFEDYRQENGDSFWWASDLMRNLGYEDPKTFVKTINRAMIACNSLNIPMYEVIREEKRIVDGKEIRDYRLSRFGCYLVSMNADVRKPQVARAQAYFITMAEAFRQYVEEAEQIERIAFREDISDHEKSLSATAKLAGVESYALFRNAGYRGLYNMHLWKLKEYKRMPKEGKTLLDYMGKEELAANLFRITQTEAKINRENISGQKPLEAAAYNVGRQVRNTMINISTHKPEDLRLTKPIDEVRKNVRMTGKKLKELDKPKKER